MMTDYQRLSLGLLSVISQGQAIKFIPLVPPGERAEIVAAWLDTVSKVTLATMEALLKDNEARQNLNPGDHA